ncbi:Gfo/Idh/MocA family oxidoreductase [bacterium]|nr:Gfo/Idh/MocA family oxidoreductase [bacterium]
MTGIAIVGCGFVADYYMETLASYPSLHLCGVYDRDAERLMAFSSHYGVARYANVDDVLRDPRVSIVLNLTNPREHYQLSRQCLLAGKHVYSEKPLAMDFAEAEDLVLLARSQGLQIASAPCSVLGVAAQTLWKAVRDGVCGKVRLVYAELDDGMLHKMPYKKWHSVTGAPWPYKDEFEVGCTLEHAGYYLTWLVAMFGEIEHIVAYSACLVPDKLPDETLSPSGTADSSLAVLRFSGGVVVRLTTTIVGPADRSIRIIGDGGVLSVNDCWNNAAPVRFRQLMSVRRKTFLSPVARRVQYKGAPVSTTTRNGATQMDFMLGVDEMAAALTSGVEASLAMELALHVNEAALVLQNASDAGVCHVMKSRLQQPMVPAEWAR